MNKKLLMLLAEIRPEYDFTASSCFIEDGLLDSFDIVTLVAALEETFSISIDGEDITPENFKNLETLGHFLQRYLKLDDPEPANKLSPDECS